MTGTVEGGKKAAANAIKKHGMAAKRSWARKGGLKKNPLKGWGSATPERRREAGQKGGTKSRRGYNNPAYTAPTDSPVTT